MVHGRERRLNAKGTTMDVYQEREFLAWIFDFGDKETDRQAVFLWDHGVFGLDSCMRVIGWWYSLCVSCDPLYLAISVNAKEGGEIMKYSCGVWWIHNFRGETKSENLWRLTCYSLFHSLSDAGLRVECWFDGVLILYMLLYADINSSFLSVLNKILINLFISQARIIH